MIFHQRTWGVTFFIILLVLHKRNAVNVFELYSEYKVCYVAKKIRNWKQRDELNSGRYSPSLARLSSFTHVYEHMAILVGELNSRRSQSEFEYPYLVKEYSYVNVQHSFPPRWPRRLLCHAMWWNVILLTDVSDAGVRTTCILAEIYRGFSQSPQLLIILSFHPILSGTLTASMNKPEIYKYINEWVNDRKGCAIAQAVSR
jgi:hypothetical protein